MGENSRRIGIYGENIVENFLKLIGWGEVPSDIEFPCLLSKKHKKTTHGIDFFFEYLSPLSDGTLNRIYISSKHTDKSYPNSPRAKFVNYFEDIVSSLECFKRSTEYRELKVGESYERVQDIALLFWLSNEDEDTESIIDKLIDVRLDKDYSYDSLYIVDNEKIGFLFKAISHSKNKFKNSSFSFFYPDTGKNINPITKENYGNILPIEYINTRVLPVRIENKLTKETYLSLYTMDDFELEDLKRLIGLSQDLTKSWPSRIFIFFPDYNETRHSNLVRQAKLSFNQQNFTRNVVVENFNTNFKSMQH